MMTGHAAKYNEITTGQGAMEKKNKLLRGWILDQGKCSQHYMSAVSIYSVTQTSKVESKWIPLHKAENLWGKEQLKMMVQAGTVKSRRMKTDKRFWEFCAFEESGSTEISNRKETRVDSQRSKAISNQQLVQFNQMDVNDMVASGFDFGDAEDGETAG